jgi:adenosylcobinamide-GDP ribazoletransferase
MTVRGLRSAVASLTPVGGASPAVSSAVAWFAPVGLAIGGVLGVIWWAAGRWWPALVAGGLVVLADLALTRLLPAGGVVDSGDGLLARYEHRRRLAVMADPTVGTFGVVTFAALLIVRWSALATRAPGQFGRLGPAVLLLAGIWCASRSLMAMATIVVPPARGGSSETAVAFEAVGSDGVEGWRSGAISAALGLAAAVGLLVAWDSVAGSVVLLVEVLAGAAVVVLANRKLGGFTGDVLGAACFVAETAALVAAAARW